MLTVTVISRILILVGLLCGLQYSAIAQLGPGEQSVQEVRQKGAKEDAFIERFLRLTPQEQVYTWLQGTPRGLGVGLAQTRMRELLIRNLPNTAPYLARILQQEKFSSELRLYVLDTLCQMDRFVPASQLTPEQITLEVAGERFNESVVSHGAFDTVKLVDGQRIGKESFEAILEVAEQQKDENLRFQARSLTGLLEQDLRQLSLPEQVRLWRETTKKAKRSRAATEEGTTSFLLQTILVQEASTSLPSLVEILNHDPDKYVRTMALSLIWQIDLVRMRLRSTETGRQAIEAVRLAIQNGKVKPTFYFVKDPQDAWQKFSAEVHSNELSLASFGGNHWLSYALALQKLYSVPATYRQSGNMYLQFTPEMKRFISYLTQVDPYFPSWEYPAKLYQTRTEEIFNPLFFKKVARYYQHWQEFVSKQSE